MTTTHCDDRAEQLPAVYRSLVEHLTEVLVLIDLDGTQVASLGPSPGPLGFNLGDRQGEHVAERIHPDDLPALLELLERGRATPGLQEDLVVRARHRDGSWRHLHVTGFSRVEDPVLRGGVLRIVDVTPRHAETPGLALDRTRFLSLAEALPVGVLSADVRGFVVFANRVAEELFDVGFDELRGERWLEQVEERHRAGVRRAIATVGVSKAPVRHTFSTCASQGRRLLELVLVPLVEADHTVGWVGTIDDATERVAAERLLAFRATHDPLTELPNRWLLLDRLEQSLARLAQRQGGVAVVFVDLDDFKAHNDLHGHAGGDAVLVDVARRLSSVLRSADTVARLGGDEFVVVSEVATEADARALADRVERALHYDLSYLGRELAVSASVGLCFTADAPMAPAALLATADAVMYERRHDARHNGRRPAFAPVSPPLG